MRERLAGPIEIAALRAAAANGTVNGAFAAALLPEVRRVVAQYPDAYFDDAAFGRAQAAVGLTHRLARAATKSATAAPFGGRSPLEAVVQDELDDSAILGVLCTDRGALLRQLLAADRARNLRGQGPWASDAARYAALGPILGEHGEVAGHEAARYRTWTAPGGVGGIVTSAADVHGIVGGGGHTSLAELVRDVLSVLGVPVTRARLLWMIGPIAWRFKAQVPVPPGVEPRRRRAAFAAWLEASKAERALLQAVVGFWSFDELLRVHGGLARQSSLCRVLDAIDRRLAPIAEGAPASWRVLAEIVGPAGAAPGEIVCRPPTPGARLLYEALHHPVAAAELLPDSPLAAIGAAAREAHPARALAEAELHQALWVSDES